MTGSQPSATGPDHFPRPCTVMGDSEAVERQNLQELHRQKVLNDYIASVCQ